LDQRINGGGAYQSVGAGGHGAEAAKLLQVLVVFLLLLVVDLAGALLLLAVVEQVVVLLLGHGSSTRQDQMFLCELVRGEMIGFLGVETVVPDASIYREGPGDAMT